MNTIRFEDRTLIPSKVVCVGRNYSEHIKELNNEIPDEMVLFCKPNSAITTELHSYIHEELHFETEVCFLYLEGRFQGVGVGLDLTKRKLQNKLKEKSLPWERAKAFNHSALFSHFVAIAPGKSEYFFELTINGDVIQSATTAQMLHTADNILEEIQSFMSLQDGDIVMTGTPKGVGIVARDALFEVKLIRDQSLLVHSKWLAQ
ncbi:MAG: fumarylacetoacetate hydrolase family protein [Aliivibrio sp.]|uniref:fumarylacetoacetate hydrolase family protein n=1 Tax=Aliivibrio sp. TaxID=1872443 RepID=UPI001A4E1ABE|nr:fumarylacetoacetate hydrolase family protein [Aliivibrio sp.]